MKEGLSEVGKHVITVVDVDAEALQLQLLHHLDLLRDERGTTRPDTEVNRALLLLQIVFGFEINYLIRKFCAVNSQTEACWQIFLQFELEVGDVVIEPSSICQCCLLIGVLALLAG